MLYQAHRGGGEGVPENTIYSFKYALEHGFNYIETDPHYTKDRKCVLMHDATVNRTCRRADGSVIEEETAISDLTYEEILKLDAGIAMGEEYKGAKVPLLDELLAMAANTDCIIKIDNKLPYDDLDTMFDIVEKYPNTKVAFGCAELEHAKIILKRFADVEIHYDGYTSDENLTAICEIVGKNPLIVWLYMDKPNFAWLNRPKVSAENCARVKKYTNLGIGNICSLYDLRDALSYEPYLVEI